jgi:hypothetical protein
VRLLVCGGRNFGTFNEERLFIRKSILDILCPAGGAALWHRGDDLIISGMAPGADTVAALFAREMLIPLDAYPISEKDWAKYGRVAGPRRNRQMIVEGNPNLVLAFNGGPGTRNMIQQAKNNNIPVVERLYGSFQR